MWTLLLALVACAPSPQDRGEVGWRRAPDIPLMDCKIDALWPSMGATADDVNGDDVVDLVWAECEQLVVRDGATGTLRSSTHGGNAAASVYTLPDPRRPGQRVIVWLGMDEVEVVTVGDDGAHTRVEGNLGLYQDDRGMIAHLALYDLAGNGELDLILGHTTRAGPFRRGIRDDGLLPPSRWTLSGGEWGRAQDYTTRVGVWHSLPDMGRPGSVLLAVDDDVSLVNLDAERAEVVPGAVALTPMGGALWWSAEHQTWEAFFSGLTRLGRFRSIGGTWFDVSEVSGLRRRVAPDVTWSVLTVDAEGDGVEEVVFSGALVAPFDDAFGFGDPHAGAEVYFAVEGDTLAPIDGLLDPTPDQHAMGGLVADVDGDLRPDVVHRGVRSSTGGAPSLVRQLANPGASWGELRFGERCAAIGAELAFDSVDGPTRRVFHPYAQGAGFGNAPLDRTWVPMAGMPWSLVTVAFTDGTTWEGPVHSGETTFVACP